MEWIDYLIVGIVVLVFGLAGYAIYRSKKSGKKCIGCPDSAGCARNCSGCSGGCIHKK